MAKKNEPEPYKQLSLDLVFTAPIAPVNEPKRMRRTKPETPAPVVEVLEPVSPTITPNYAPHESAIRRETTAFDLYQRSAKETRTLLLVAFVLSLVLIATKMDTTTVDKVSLLGLDLKINDRSVIVGILGMGSLFFGGWALLTAFSTWALWKKCGLFYQDIVRPISHPLLVALFNAVWFMGALLISVVVLSSIVYSIGDMAYVIFGAPKWVTQWVTDVKKN